MGMFKQFLTESPTSIDFLTTIANGRKLTYPDTTKEFVFKNDEFPSGYNMVMEVINKYLIELQKNPNLENSVIDYPQKRDLELLKTIFPIPIGPGARLSVLKMHLKTPFPIWDIVENKIFLLDVNGNSYSAYSNDNFSVCDAYKKFMLYALNEEEHNKQFSTRISKAIII